MPVCGLGPRLRRVQGVLECPKVFDNDSYAAVVELVDAWELKAPLKG